jgi:hypothetical protein
MIRNLETRPPISISRCRECGRLSSTARRIERPEGVAYQHGCLSCGAVWLKLKAKSATEED